MIKKMKNKHAGFTLIEIIIALLIFSIVAVIAANSLFLLIRAKKINQAHAKTLGQQQIALSLLKSDLENYIKRPIRTVNLRLSPALVLTQNQDVTLSLTRKNVLYSTQQAQTLNRVDYYFSQGTLTRRVWPVLDRAPNSQANARILLSHLASFHVTIISQQQHRYSTWPVSVMIEKSAAPLAAEITLCFSAQDCLTQTIAMAAPQHEPIILPITR